MNCFEWQNRISDYLDGTLIGTAQREADEHVETCQICCQRQKHYRLILSTLSNQPRSTLPVPIRKSPLGFALPKIDLRNRKTRWEQTPWLIRTSAEGLGVAALILLVVALVPRVRTLYEQSIERRLGAFNLSEFSFDSESGHPAADVPLSRGKVIAVSDTAADPSAHDDDFAGGENEGSADDADSDTTTPETAVVLNENGKNIQIGESEIWRFNMKTDSPHEVRPKIVHTLTELNVATSTPGFGGIEAPGGIQFDIVVPKSVVPGLKLQLEKLAQQNIQSRNQTNANVSDIFTWYKNKSKRKIPGGKTRVVVWLSQM